MAECCGEIRHGVCGAGGQCGKPRVPGDGRPGGAGGAAADAAGRAVVAASLLRERKIVIARLQRLGVHVIEAPYERLGTDLVNAYLDLKKRDLL